MRLAAFELRRFTRAPLTIAALIVLTLIPLLYGALYLWAFWDPYGNLRHIPVAVVNADRPAAIDSGGTLHAGEDLAESLRRRDVFGWHRTGAAEAREGLREGRYHLVFEIPADFSSSLVAAPDPARDPARGRLLVLSDDANGYLSGQLSRTVFAEVRASATSTAASRYFDRMLIGFAELKERTGAASDGAARLADGATEVRHGAGQAAGGADAARAGSGRLVEGLDAAAAGTERLADGLATLDAGAGQLADGTAKAAAGGRLLAERVNAAPDPATTLRQTGERLAGAATAIATGADAVAAHLTGLTALADDVTRQARESRTRLDELAPVEPAKADAYRAALAAADQTVARAEELRTRLGAGELAAIRDRMVKVAGEARALAAAAPQFGSDAAAARTQINALAEALTGLAGGADRLHQGVTAAKTGARDLNSGLYRLATGARQLDGGLDRLADGTHQLAGGLGQLEAGASQLAAGLTEGAAKIPGYDPDSRAERAGVLGDPVQLDRRTEHAAATYGTGFAPYFLGLALWVGAMITYMILRPITRRHLVSGAPPHRVALAGWLPGLVIGVLQATALFLVLRFAVGLNPANPVTTWAYLCLTAMTFTAILQLLGARLGPAGRLAALALLMLQLTSSGGTYPVETTPGFLQAIHPYLPMTYVVGGLRHLINGGSTGTVATGAVVLVGFAAAAFALTTLTAWRGRRLTPSKLHPDLVM